MSNPEKASLPAKVRQLAIFKGLQMFKSIVGTAPADRLTDNPRAYETLITIAEAYATGSTKDKGAYQIHSALRVPEDFERDRKTVEVIQCLVCMRFLSQKHWRAHN